MLPAGLIGDRYGRKKVMLASLAAFGAGSALCAYAPSPGVFLVARLLMGLAGAGITVMALSALTGLAVASHLRSPSLSHSARAAFVHGMDASLLVSAGIAAAGVILTLTFLHRPAARERSEPPMRVAARVSEP
ncbi:MAG TPA: MFS transporter [Streptosporangiaceae bacterium]|nr:MFS transporter [Streptosporangiaceae bacterium]